MAVVVLLILSVAACDDGESVPSTTGDANAVDPLFDNLAPARAELPAVDGEWFLFRVSNRYSPVADELRLESHSYLFATAGAGSTYFVVHVDAAGGVQSGPVAGGVLAEPLVYDPAANVLSAEEALARASSYGTSVVERCGPLRWVVVTGGISEDRTPEGGQWWSVGYRVGPTQNTIFMDAVTGDLIERDEIACE